MELLDEHARNNYAILRDCLAEPIILKSAPAPRSAKGRKPKGRKTSLANPVSEPPTSPSNDTSDDAADLADFIDYLASEIFTSFPPNLQTLSYASIKDSPRLAATYADPLPAATTSRLLASIPPSVPDTLTSYRLLPPTTSTTGTISAFLTPILHHYVSSTTAPLPPPHQQHQHQHRNHKRPPACEICSRDWIPLTYHHLIPRSTHAKALKRGWHEESRLQSVAWLCRACHSFVHGLCGNEELARRWWSVGLLMGREDVRGWAEWAGRVRWGKR